MIIGFVTNLQGTVLSKPINSEEAIRLSEGDGLQSEVVIDTTNGAFDLSLPNDKKISIPQGNCIILTPLTVEALLKNRDEALELLNQLNALQLNTKKNKNDRILFYLLLMALFAIIISGSYMLMDDGYDSGAVSAGFLTTAMLFVNEMFVEENKSLFDSDTLNFYGLLPVNDSDEIELLNQLADTGAGEEVLGDGASTPLAVDGPQSSTDVSSGFDTVTSNTPPSTDGSTNEVFLFDATPDTPPSPTTPPITEAPPTTGGPETPTPPPPAPPPPPESAQLAPIEVDIQTFTSPIGARVTNTVNFEIQGDTPEGQPQYSRDGGVTWIDFTNGDSIQLDDGTYAREDILFRQTSTDPDFTDSEISDMDEFVMDGESPDLTNINSTLNNVSKDVPTELTLQFSEPVFSLDPTVQGGRFESLTQDPTDPSIWRGTFIPDGTDILITLPEGSYQDYAGNFNENPDEFDINLIPIANDDTAATDEDTPITINVLDNDTDAEGDPLTVTTAMAANGQVVVNLDGTITYTPNEDFNGSDTITYIIEDGNGGTDTATVNVDVAPVVDTTNVSLTGPATIAEGQNVTITATVDAAPSGGSLVLTLNNGQTITIADGQTTGTVTFIAQGEDAFIDAGTETFSVTGVTNNGSAYENLVTTDTHEVVVTDTIDTTTISINATVDEQSNTGVITASVDNEVTNSDLVITLVNSVVIIIPVGQTSGTSSSFTLPPPGTTSVGIQSTTGGNYESLNISDTVDIVSTNQAPDASNNTITTNEDTTYTFTAADFNFSDVDTGDTLQAVRITTLPLGGALLLDGNALNAGDDVSISDINGGLLTFEPDLHESGNPYVTFDFQVSDGVAFSADSTLTVDVTADADAPTIDTAVVTVNFTDPSSPDFASLGLTESIWNNISNVLNLSTTGNGEIPTSLVTKINTASVNPDQITRVDDVNSDDGPLETPDPNNAVPAGQANLTEGLIYLEAGTDYTFGGYADDSLNILIAGDSIAISTWGNNQGSIVDPDNSNNPPSPFTPSVSGFYTLAVYHHNGSGPGNFDITINGVSLSTDNFSLYETPEQIEALGVRIGEEQDGFYEILTLNEGGAGTDIPLSGIDVALVDTDGSESITETSISDIPVGVTISDGINSFTSTVGSQSVSVLGWNLSMLELTTPLSFSGTFDLTVTATSTEASNGDSAQTSSTLSVNVLPGNTVPTLDIQNGYGFNDAGTEIQGTLVDYGLDGFGSFDIDANAADLLNDQRLTADGDLITWTLDVATDELVGNVTRDGVSEEIARLSVDETTGTYDFNMSEAIDGINVNLAQAGNNQPTLYINSEGVLSTSPADANVTITSSEILNRNGNGLGVGNNAFIEAGESMTFTFNNAVTTAQFSLSKFVGDNDTYDYTVQYVNGTSQTYTNQTVDPISVNGGLEIQSITITGAGANSTKFFVETFVLEKDIVELEVPFTATDSNGDAVSGQVKFVLHPDELTLEDLDGETGDFIMDVDTDTLLIDDASLVNFEGTISGGDGFDTIDINQDDMDLSEAELLDNFGHGFQFINMSGNGSNTINLTLEVVNQLSEDSAYSVEGDNNGQTYYHVLKIEGDNTDEIDSDVTWQVLDTANGGASTLYQLGPDAGTAPVVEVVNIIDIQPTPVVDAG